MSIETQSKMIETFLNKRNSTILVVEEKKELVGYLLANGAKQRKINIRLT